MNPERLREIVLINAIEESDRIGEVISRKERDRATRMARTSNGMPESGAMDSVTDEQLAKAIADRATILAGPVLAKHQIFLAAFASSQWPALLMLVVLPIALASGLGIRWISGLNRVNFMSAPVALLIVWNVSIYVGLFVAWTLSLRKGEQKRHFWRDLAAHVINRRLAPLVSQTSRVDIVLGESIARFAAIWNVAAGAVIGQRLRQVAHVGGAAVGLGLIAGLLYRAWDHDFLGGWESSHRPATVKAIADLCLKPFVGLVDMQYPRTVDQFAALKFTGVDYASSPALPWVGLLTLLILAVVVLPRLALTGLASLRIARLERSLTLPESLLKYSRATLGLRGHEPAMKIAVFPYEIAVTLDIQKRLRSAIQDAFGSGAVPAMYGAVAVGDERAIDKLISEAAKDADGLVILTSIQSEPNDKHHGVLLATAHDRVLSPALGIDLKLLIDDCWITPWGVPERIQRWRRSRRKRLWRSFAKRYRVAATFIRVEAIPLGVKIQQRNSVTESSA